AHAYVMRGSRYTLSPTWPNAVAASAYLCDEYNEIASIDRADVSLGSFSTATWKARAASSLFPSFSAAKPTLRITPGVELSHFSASWKCDSANPNCPRLASDVPQSL